VAIVSYRPTARSSSALVILDRPLMFFSAASAGPMLDLASFVSDLVKLEGVR
jgi:hypothetical protein